MKPACHKALLIFLLFLSFVTACHEGQQLTPAGILTESEALELRAATIRQAPMFLNRIPVGRERQFGFDNRDQFAQAMPGQPFGICTIDPALILGEAADSQSIQVLDEFRVPLTVDGRARALLTFERVDGTFRATDLGAAGLAAELEETLGNQGFDIDSTRRGCILRLYQAGSDFLIPDIAGPSDELRVIPLKSARIGLGLDRQEPFVSTLPQMLPSIRRTLLVADIAKKIPDGVAQP